MSATSCVPTAISVTESLAKPEVQEAWRALRARNADPSEYVDSMCAVTPPEIAATIREEFAELPALTVPTLVEAWAMADAAGKEFAFRSAAPVEPVLFARNHRVRLTIDADEDRVTLTLGHVPTRHAEWYRLGRAAERTPALAGIV